MILPAVNHPVTATAAVATVSVTAGLTLEVSTVTAALRTPGTLRAASAVSTVTATPNTPTGHPVMRWADFLMFKQNHSVKMFHQ